jgi:hypothetical protein
MANEKRDRFEKFVVHISQIPKFIANTRVASPVFVNPRFLSCLLLHMRAPLVDGVFLHLPEGKQKVATERWKRQGGMRYAVVGILLCTNEWIAGNC